MADKKKPAHVLALIAKHSTPKDKPVRGKPVIPEATLFNRLRRRKK